MKIHHWQGQPLAGQDSSKVSNILNHKKDKLYTLWPTTVNSAITDIQTKSNLDASKTKLYIGS